MNSDLEPLALDELLTLDERRTISVDDHDRFRRSLATDDRRVDDFDDLVEIDPHVSGTNNRRSDRELANLLDVIDNLPISTNGKEGLH